MWPWRQSTAVGASRSERRRSALAVCRPDAANDHARWRARAVCALRAGASIAATALCIAACGGGANTATTGTGSSGAAGGQSVNGVRAASAPVLASATWQGMRITARALKPAPFVVFNGTSTTTIKPTRRDSFQLMIMLADAESGVAIPYATVSTTIRSGARVVYRDRQWPMISAFLGPGYGNNVSLPGAGSYRLSLLITPPVSARHLEYQNIWLKPHRVDLAFHWTPGT
jgi:hypothetical protein